jgi:hypothetical protein
LESEIDEYFDTIIKSIVNAGKYVGINSLGPVLSLNYSSGLENSGYFCIAE